MSTPTYVGNTGFSLGVHVDNAGAYYAIAGPMSGQNHADWIGRQGVVLHGMNPLANTSMEMWRMYGEGAAVEGLGGKPVPPGCTVYMPREDSAAQETLRGLLARHTRTTPIAPR